MDFWAIQSFKRGNPTVKPADNFKPEEDAEILRIAVEGSWTEEDTLIRILCHRSNYQRLEIVKTFKTIYGRDLVQEIKRETSGYFQELLVALLAQPTDFYAQELHGALKGFVTHKMCLIELMCSLNNEQIEHVKETYEQLFKKPLEEDLVDDISGNLKRLLRSLCTARRSEVDDEKARKDAERLSEAGGLKLGEDEATFNEILASQSYDQLMQVFSEYENLTGNTIERAIEKEFSGAIKETVLSIVKFVRSKTNFYAERLYKSMKGLGTDNKALIRLIVTHCEVDLMDIKRSFLVLYEQPLESFIEDDTSGDYRTALIALVKEDEE